MAKDTPFMLLVERYEVQVLIEALMLHRDKCIEEWGSPDNRTDVLLKRVMLHAGLPYCKEVVPDAYKLVFPEGPPQVVGPYGKHNK